MVCKEVECVIVLWVLMCQEALRQENFAFFLLIISQSCKFVRGICNLVLAKVRLYLNRTE